MTETTDIFWLDGLPFAIENNQNLRITILAVADWSGSNRGEEIWRGIETLRGSIKTEPSTQGKHSNL